MSAKTAALQTMGDYLAGQVMNNLLSKGNCIPIMASPNPKPSKHRCK